MTLLTTSRVMYLVHIAGVALIRAQDSRIGYAILFFCRTLSVMLTGYLLAALLAPMAGSDVDKRHMILLLGMSVLLGYRIVWIWKQRLHFPVGFSSGLRSGLATWQQGVVRYCVKEMLTIVAMGLWLSLIYR